MKFHAIPLMVVLVISSVCCNNCAPKTIVTTPDKAVWYANQVTIRVNEISKTVIQLNANGQITDVDTRAFGKWATGALITLRDVPNGWEKTVKTGWDEIKTKLPQSNPTLSTLVAVMDSLLTLLNPIGV
jgi:(2Fe-2S) ferredoxin